jgi:hypothetical protein
MSISAVSFAWAGRLNLEQWNERRERTAFSCSSALLKIEYGVGGVGLAFGPGGDVQKGEPQSECAAYQM